MKKDYVVTFITEFIVLISGIFVYKLAATFLGKDGFSEYALSRRTVSLIQPALLMGLGVGIPRYIAYAQTSPDHKSPDGYFIGGLSALFISALTVALILNLLKDNISFLLFGDIHYAYLIFPISLMLLGLVLHASCYSYFRGRLLMLRANFLQMINLGIVPLCAFFARDTTDGVLTIIGSAWLIVSFSFLLFIIRNLKWDKNIKKCVKELLVYGLQRVPGDFGLAALLTLPATLTAHISGVKEAGYVAFGISLLNMAGTAFAPVGLILLPKASQIIASKDFKQLKYYASKLLKITLLLTMSGVIFFEIFADRIITLYLGESFSDILSVARIIMVAAIAYTVYVTMRSIIDAYYVKAINTINILITFSFFIILAGTALSLNAGYTYIVTSFVIAMFLLGGLTLRHIRKLSRVST